MSTQSIFQAPAQGRGKPLVEFKAGKMLVRGKMVTPDTRKGLVQLNQEADGLMHFVWKDRGTKLTETDLIVFPEDGIEFKRIKQCTTGRVYLLEWQQTGRRLFFWMQEPSESKDEENCRKINEYIKNPPTQEATQQGNGMGGLDQNQLYQMMGGAPQSPSSTQPSSGGSIPETALEAALRGIMGGSVPASTQPTQTQTQNTTPTRPDLNLSSVINAEAIMPLLDDPEFQQQLIAHLPEGSEQTPEELVEMLHSPQFQQSLGTINAALQTGQLGELMPMFGLPQTAVPGVRALLEALREQHAQEEDEKDEEKDESEDQMDSS
eukprot:CAMPEP_0174261442 /NCGR_PEP_ID=MMETSP0439-20130205/11433_1 /TAXON_ID=0 /ORGANISM="Stereomyxa ramosa, Strain Chinc5" /LENGTH=320 /DNA_ID=CAMNT_0015345917 /DNA_START=32 /DNA_END=994 /DNA_ORIENTATION=-